MDKSKTIMQGIMDHMQAHGYTVYAPTQAIGVVKAPYVVVTYLGSAKHNTFSTIIERYSVILFLPHRLYSELQAHTQGIEDTMRKLHPQLIYDDFGGSPVYDDNMKCYQVPTDYLSYKRMNTKITPLRT
jgi:hypothetical protein